MITTWHFNKIGTSLMLLIPTYYAEINNPIKIVNPDELAGKINSTIITLQQCIEGIIIPLMKMALVLTVGVFIIGMIVRSRAVKIIGLIGMTACIFGFLLYRVFSIVIQFII